MVNQSIFNDKNYSLNECLNIPITILCLIFIGYGIYIGIYFFWGLDNLIEKALALFATVVAVNAWISCLYNIIEGRRIVSSIIFYNHHIMITNLLKQKIYIDNKDLKSVKFGNTGGLIVTSPDFNKNKKNLTISLKSNNFYRVSTNMERIEELKKELEQIISNQPGK